MKTVSSDVQTRLSQNLGTRPINIVQIGTLKYSDHDFQGIKGGIISLGVLDQQSNDDNSSASTNISVTLDDSSGELKHLFDTSDLYKLRAVVYQCFEDLPEQQKFIVVDGIVNTPVEWDEGKRTFRFDIVSNLEQKETGFSLDEALAKFIPNTILGKPLPMVFGSCRRVPAVTMTEEVKGILLEPFGIRDFTLQDKLAFLTFKLEELNVLAQLYAQTAALLEFQGDKAGASQYIAALNTTLDSITTATEDFIEASETLTAQTRWEKLRLSCSNAKNFPSGQITVKIDQAFIHCVAGSDDALYVGGNTYPGSHPEYTSKTLERQQQIIKEGLFTEPVSSSFYGVPSATEVHVDSPFPVEYLAAIMPCTVLKVYAKKTIKGQTLLWPVPSNLYTVSLQTIKNLTVTKIVFPKPLSSLNLHKETDDEGDWDGTKIWCDLVSTVGPNTVDEIQWVAEKFTNLSIDSTSFAYVHEKINKFPSHFAMLERKNAMDMIREMAWQARCAVYVLNQTLYIKYLSYEATVVDTLEEQDFLNKTMVISSSSTDKLVTKLTGKWQDRYDVDTPNITSVRNNVAKYGLREKQVDMYIYDTVELVLKSLTFWIIRYSNVWKYISGSSPLKNLRLDIFDSVALDFQGKYLCKGIPTCILEGLGYDTTRKELNLRFWTPVRVGENNIFPLAYPGSVASETQYNGTGGEGPASGASIQPEIGPIYRFEITRPAREVSRGDKYPSDRHPFSRSVVGVNGPSENVIRTSPTGVSDFTLGTYPAPPPTISETTGGGIPCEIVSGSGKNYSIKIYPQGLSGPTQLVAAQQLQISNEETIPPGTWAFASKSGVIYFIQVPVWL